MIHNHPSGDPTPSLSDVEATKDIGNVLNKLNIHLFDHIVLGDNRFYSITESKLYDEIEK